MFSYSVIIRTVGNTGEKYRRLIDSIQKQTIRPENVIVVLPECNDIEYISGMETIVHAPKGMVSQRSAGILLCHSDYMLVVDDDIEFKPNMVEELHDYLIANNLDCCLPMEGSPSGKGSMSFSLPMKSRLRNAFTGQVFATKREGQYLDKITLTAGHKVYSGVWDTNKCYLVQTGNFQCFFGKSDICKSVHLEEELWLQEGLVTHYSSYDDSVFYYKLFLNGGRIGYALKTRYSHLDAAAGRPAKTLLESKIIRYYSVARNRTIFWMKFIWSRDKHTIKAPITLLCGIYGMVNYGLWNLIICIRPKYWKAISAMLKGYRDAFAYCKTCKI